MSERYITVGKLVNTHGIKGEVRVISETDFPEERYKKGNRLYLLHPRFPEPVPLIVNSRRKHKHFDLLTFEAHESINDVEKYKGGRLVIPIEELHELPEGEYYFHEIIGCDVYDEEGQLLGKVKEILTPGANDVWVVELAESKKELLLPVIDDCILDVDVKGKKIIARVLEGLLDES
ncbi:ribosome maturation factor RimM [Bacillaceae bacterium]